MGAGTEKRADQPIRSFDFHNNDQSTRGGLFFNMVPQTLNRRHYLPLAYESRIEFDLHIAEAIAGRYGFNTRQFILDAFQFHGAIRAVHVLDLIGFFDHTASQVEHYPTGVHAHRASELHLCP